MINMHTIIVAKFNFRPSEFIGSIRNHCVIHYFIREYYGYNDLNKHSEGKFKFIHTTKTLALSHGERENIIDKVNKTILVNKRFFMCLIFQQNYYAIKKQNEEF